MSLTPGCNRRILIVDDNEGIHGDFRQILGGTSEADLALAATEAALFGDSQIVLRERFELESAYQGQEALQMVNRALAQGRPYAMAFVDMRMPPGWDGVETIEHLWRSDPQLQVVICSAHTDYSWEEMSKRLELRDRLLFLKKPFDNIEIYQLATALTAKWRLSREASQRMASLESAVEGRTRELRTANEALQAEALERRRLQGQLALRQKLESIGQLAAGVAHEINTPIQYIADSIYFLSSAYGDLNTLQGHYEQLLGLEGESEAAASACAAVKQARAAADVDFLRQEIPQACERALAGVDRVAKIVCAMREFAHTKEGEQCLADINEGLASTLIVARSEYKYVAEVETRLGNLPPVICSISELNQVFLNLVVNAAHAIDAAGKNVSTGRIIVRTAADETHVSISIADNGTGIPAAIGEKIYDPFFTTKEVGKGTGQGLALAYAIVVKSHGGTLTFDSTEGEGTEFTLRIPIAGLAPPSAGTQ